MRSSLALLVAAGLLAAAAPVALADGDPASDYLLGQPTFVPPDAGVSAAAATQLGAVLADAKRKGYEVRVAVIATRYDLGSAGVLFRKPTEYARFLGQELFFVYKGRLVVAMPNGYGVSRGGKPQPRQQALLDRLPPPGRSGLATGAARAVRVLARAAGVGVASPQALRASGGGAGNRDRLIVAAAAIVLALAAAAVAGRRRLRRWATR